MERSNGIPMEIFRLMAAHSRPMTDFLTRTKILTENLPEKGIPLSPDAETQEHEKAILYKEVSKQEWTSFC